MHLNYYYLKLYLRGYALSRAPSSCLCYLFALLTCASSWVNELTHCCGVRCVSAERQPDVTWRTRSHHVTESRRGPEWHFTAPWRWPTAVDDWWSEIVFLRQPAQSHDVTCIHRLLCSTTCPGYFCYTWIRQEMGQICVQAGSKLTNILPVFFMKQTNINFEQCC